MQLLFLLALGYALTADNKAAPAQTQAPRPQAPPPGASFATELGAFVGGLIGQAVKQYGKDDSP